MSEGIDGERSGAKVCTMDVDAIAAEAARLAQAAYDARRAFTDFCAEHLDSGALPQDFVPPALVSHTREEMGRIRRIQELERELHYERTVERARLVRETTDAKEEAAFCRKNMQGAHRTAGEFMSIANLVRAHLNMQDAPVEEVEKAITAALSLHHPAKGASEMLTTALRLALIVGDAWNQWAYRRSDGTLYAGGLSTLEDIEEALPLIDEVKEAAGRAAEPPCGQECEAWGCCYGLRKDECAMFLHERLVYAQEPA